jgi:hypothetical protein
MGGIDSQPAMKAPACALFIRIGSLDRRDWPRAGRDGWAKGSISNY